MSLAPRHARRSAPRGERVYVDLRDAILRAALEPGRKLSENELAAEYGVSRTPVREAIAALREERLVAIVPQLGTFVTRISETAVEDAAFVREALECAAVRLAAQRAGADDLQDLSAMLDAQAAAVDAADPDRFDDLDVEFHRRLCDIAGRRIAWDLAQRANGHLDRVRRLSLPDPGYLAEMLTEHRSVVAAIADHDQEAADAALRHHLRMVLSGLARLQETHPEFFTDDRL